MNSSVDATPAANAFEVFVFISLIALLAAFFTMVVRHSSISYERGSFYSTALQPEGGRHLFRGLIRIPSFDFSSAADEELRMSPQALMDRWQPFIKEASERFSVPQDWIRTVIRIESGGRTMLSGKPITSSAGAMGVMQLMQQTYDEMRVRNGLGADPYNAHDNILAGAAYLRDLYNRYGYPHLFAAYNAGPGRLEDHLLHGHKLPAETRAYVRLATYGAYDESSEPKKKVRSKHATRVAAIYQPAS